MTGRYKAYSEYKDSGVEWLGDVPKDWNIWKLAHAYDVIGSGTTPPSGSDQWYNGDIPWITTGELREKEIFDTAKKITKETLRVFPTLRKYPKGSIAIAMYGATIGRLGIFGVEATTNQACCVLSSSDVIDNTYLFYWLQAFRQDIVNLSLGGGQPNINQEIVASLKLSSPNIKEQTQISNFLDHETGKIDELIEKQQLLIKLLKEKRQAVISHAVTKGLNPSAPMRDSGVEWLGVIPEHWEVCQLKHMAKIKNGKDYKHVEVENGFPVIGSGGQFTYSSQFVYNKESVLLGRKGTIDKPLYIKEPFWTVDTMYYTEVNLEIPVKYLYYLAVTIQFNKYSTNTALPSMTQEHLSNYLFAVPKGRNEKEAIFTYLDDQTTKIDGLIEKANSAIQLMQERRTALISAAVTGKIDVRDWQMPTQAKSKKEEAS